jgi:hypothetical protein
VRDSGKDAAGLPLHTPASSLRHRSFCTYRPARSSALSSRIRAIVVLVAALALLTAGCSSGKKQPAAAPTTSAAATTTTQVARPLALKLTTTARGPEHGFDAKKAAKKASPSLQRFLDRYVTVAFLQPDQGKSGWRDLLAMFDGPVRVRAGTQLNALSLGSAAARVTAVRPGPARANAVVLFDGGREVAATVRLSFDGTADSQQGSGPVHLRSVLQLLAGKSGWRIAAYQSRTGG